MIGLRFTIGPLKAIHVFLLKYIGTVRVYFDKIVNSQLLGKTNQRFLSVVLKYYYDVSLYHKGGGLNRDNNGLNNDKQRENDEHNVQI